MSKDHNYFVYIVTNHTNTVLYIGVTNDLRVRVSQHILGEGSKFTRKYNVNQLLYHECFRDVDRAIDREKQLKGWTRAKKEALIRTTNPTYEDLSWQLDPNATIGCRRPEGPSTALHSAQDDRKGDIVNQENVNGTDHS